jgi:uncharacterized FlgJ-related protein
MFYKFDQHQLAFVRDKKGFKICLGVLTGVALITFFLGRYAQFKALDKYEKELVILNLEKERNKFTDEKFIELVKELNMKFPHIVYAQAKIESGNFKSAVFKQNNNLFGMKQARARVNTAKGTNLNHAYYDNWKESVYDYAFYQCRYMSNASTEEEYYATLDASYAEAGDSYSRSLKQIIEREKIKSKF